MLEIAKGKYERISEEGFEEMLRALEVNFFLRKAAVTSNPVMEITEKDGLWTIKMATIVKSIERYFRINKPFDEITADGREVASVMMLEGNRMVLVQNAKKAGHKSTIAIREFDYEGCTLTTEIIGENVICVQKFKRI